MVSFSRLCFLLATATSIDVSVAQVQRIKAQRLRTGVGSSTTLSSSISSYLPNYGSYLKDFDYEATQKDKEVLSAMEEAFQMLATDTLSMSMVVPTEAPSDNPSATPSAAPTKAPSASPSAAPTKAPTDAPTVVTLPLEGPTPAPTPPSPPHGICPGITVQERIDQILAILDAVADPTEIRDVNIPQGKATVWLLEQDTFQICPDNDKLVQRWALAVIYFSTGGDSWLQCSANPAAVDSCGTESPFSSNQERFLSSANECTWAGISCIDGCVTEIEFEENNLAGTIPTEIGLLHDLIIWGMERGTLTSTIPTEVGQLTNLIFIDLDFNQLTGTLTPELLSLSSLTQLDLNNNQLSGPIDGIDGFPNMEFLQLHDNLFSGTVPDTVGTYSNLSAFTLHETFIGGSMPPSVCDLLVSENNGGVLTSLIADCSLPQPDIQCTCCTDCRAS